MEQNYCIKAGYRARGRPDYFKDVLREETGVVWQPDVYALAASLARRAGCTQLVDIGCGRADKLIEFAEAFDIVGIDHGWNIEYCQRTHRAGRWLDVDLEEPGGLPLPPAELKLAALVCSDVVEHLVDPRPLLQRLRRILAYAPLAVISTPERDLCRGREHLGPPPNPSHVREWNLEEFERFLRQEGLVVEFIGLTRRNTDSSFRGTLVASVTGDARGNAPFVPGRRGDAVSVQSGVVSFLPSPHR